ncbi:MAG: ABC transporter permease [Propionibacteriaceae bacterium]|nr:ABC transporter permease [Propionibacteriaceae bacterium]
MLGAIDQGLITALLALGVFLTFRILNFADLTVDGSFTAGTATAAILIFNGVSPVVAALAGLVAGALAGCVTGLLHTKAHIDPLLASILVMLAMYSVNTHIMWFGYDGKHRSTVSLLNKETIFTWIIENRLRGSAVSITLIAVGVIIILVLLNWFLSTKFGLAVMATGDNPAMASAMGISTDFAKIVTLMISNGLVGLCGGVMVQYVGSAAIGDGTGMILIGLASVILGNAIFGTRYMWLMTFGVVIGAVLYRVAIFWALRWEFIDNADMKLISAALVVIALVVSQWKGAHALVTKLSPWRPKEDDPEPMASVPNQFSPFANVDGAAMSAVAPVTGHVTLTEHEKEESSTQPLAEPGKGLDDA